MLNINKYNLNNFITSRHILTLNFFQVYVYLLIIKYYSIYALKIYSNYFLNLLNLARQKAFIYKL